MAKTKKVRARIPLATNKERKQYEMRQRRMEQIHQATGIGFVNDAWLFVGSAIANVHGTILALAKAGHVDNEAQQNLQIIRLALERARAQVEALRPLEPFDDSGSAAMSPRRVRSTKSKRRRRLGR